MLLCAAKTLDPPKLATPLFRASAETKVADDSEGNLDDPRTMRNYAGEDWIPLWMPPAPVVLLWSFTVSPDH